MQGAPATRSRQADGSLTALPGYHMQNTPLTCRQLAARSGQSRAHISLRTLGRLTDGGVVSASILSNIIKDFSIHFENIESLRSKLYKKKTPFFEDMVNKEKSLCLIIMNTLPPLASLYIMDVVC